MMLGLKRSGVIKYYIMTIAAAVLFLLPASSYAIDPVYKDVTEQAVTDYLQSSDYKNPPPAFKKAKEQLKAESALIQEILADPASYPAAQFNTFDNVLKQKDELRKKRKHN